MPDKPACGLGTGLGLEGPMRITEASEDRFCQREQIAALSDARFHACLEVKERWAA